MIRRLLAWLNRPAEEVPDPVTWTAKLPPRTNVDMYIEEQTEQFGWTFVERHRDKYGQHLVTFHRTDGRYQWLKNGSHGLP